MRTEPAIGFFDSGLGGISVLAAAMKALPQERFLYYGDSANAPYGTKTAEEVCRLTGAAVQEMVLDGVKALVIACNTASGAAAKGLRERYTMPIIALEPALKLAHETHGQGTILVMATPLTFENENYKRLFSSYGEHAVSLPCPGLMDFVEREELESPALDRYLEALFEPFLARDTDAVVLGCTHYLFLRDAIVRHLPEGVRIVDGNGGVVRQLQKKLAENGLLAPSGAKGDIRLKSSGGREKAEQMERMLARALRL